MDPDERLAALDLEGHARGRVVVEALRVADVLEADGITHPSLYRLAVCHVGDAARKLAQVPAHHLLLLRQGHALDPPQDLGHRGGPGHLLPERERIPWLDRVLYAELDRVHAELPRQLVHLGLVGEAHLHGAEPAHRAAGWVVGVDHVGIHQRVRHLVWAAGEAGRVGADGGRAGSVGSSVEDDARLHVDELPVAVGAVLVAHPGRVPVHVPEKGLLAVVHHLDRALGVESEEAGVGLHGEVFPAPEGATHAREGEPHPLRGQVEALGQLILVDVQPLRGDVQVHPALAVGHGQAGLGAQKRLVLHPDLVLSLNDDGRLRVLGVAVDCVDVTEEVAGGVQLGRLLGHRLLGIGQGFEYLVLHCYLLSRAPGSRGVVGGDDGDGLALIADVFPGEHGLVGDLHPVDLASRDVLVGKHGVHARHRLRLRGVGGPDPGVRVGAPQRGPPQHPVHPQVRGIFELARNLRNAVGADRVLPHLPWRRGRGTGGRRWHRLPASHRATSSALSASRRPAVAISLAIPPSSTVSSSASRTTGSPPTSSSSTRGAGPKTRAAMGSETPAWARSSTRHRATSASFPGASEPISASLPRQRAPWTVASSSACRAVSALGPPARRAKSNASRISIPSSPASLEAAPSAPSPTGEPARTSSATGAMPAPSLALEDGQWATPVPVSPKRCTSASFRCTQWASQTSSPSHPRSSRYSAGLTPKCSRQNSSSSSVSARWVWSLTPRLRASSAVSAMSSRVTEKGEQGARAILSIESGEGSWKRSMASSLAARISSRSSTASSGGSPPRELPKSIEPRQGWNRSPNSRAVSTSTPRRSPAPRGNT